MKSVPEMFLRTLPCSHHGQVQSLKFYKLCFHQREYYEQLSLYVQPEMETQERNRSSECASEEVCCWQVTLLLDAQAHNTVPKVTSNVVMTKMIMTTSLKY